ncbi:hypothetical protein [Streptomyces mirabilis]|uniref:hypothetical protein n=1 Tax=Streptomyces mirabilis TaxID=68239 RepID=UPI0036B74FBB
MRSPYAPLGDGLALYDLVAVAVAVAVDVLVQVAVGMFEYELLNAVLRSLDRAERARGHRAGRPPEAPLWLGLIGRLTG